MQQAQTLQCRWTAGSDTSSAIQAENVSTLLLLVPEGFAGSALSIEVSPDNGTTWLLVAANNGSGPAAAPVGDGEAHSFSPPFCPFLGNIPFRFVSNSSQTADSLMTVVVA